jgi:hypothetical protein
MLQLYRALETTVHNQCDWKARRSSWTLWKAKVILYRRWAAKARILIALARKLVYIRCCYLDSLPRYRVQERQIKLSCRCAWCGEHRYCWLRPCVQSCDIRSSGACTDWGNEVQARESSMLCASSLSLYWFVHLMVWLMEPRRHILPHK